MIDRDSLDRASSMNDISGPSFRRRRNRAARRQSVARPRRRPRPYPARYRPQYRPTARPWPAWTVGSGKSTLLMVMTGLERPDTGSVMVAGQDLRQARRGRPGALSRQPCRHRVPGVSSDPDHDGAGERRRAARTRRRARRLRARRARACRGRACRSGSHHYPAELSGGEQQRVALARALAPNPAILVADEPTGNLDEATGREIIELLFRGHRERGTTLVLVTHDTDLAARCDRVLHMHSGQIAQPRRRTPVRS